MLRDLKNFFQDNKIMITVLIVALAIIITIIIVINNLVAKEIEMGNNISMKNEFSYGNVIEFENNVNVNNITNTINGNQISNEINNSIGGGNEGGNPGGNTGENLEENTGENPGENPGGNTEIKPEFPLTQLLKNNGYDVDKYFRDPDPKINEANIRKILYAEVVTQYPHISTWSPDKINGVIRFKRITSEDSAENTDYEEDNASNNIGDVLQDCLTYVTNEEFNAWIEEYNADNNNAESKVNAMNSFTLTADNQKVQVAVLKSVQVKANDTNKDIRGKSEQEITRIMDTIKSELGEKFQKAAYTVTTDSATGEIIYNFEILEAIEVDYKNLIQKYTMPSDLLFSLLTYSKDLDFVLKIADLAYNSTIIVGIHDSGSSVLTNYKEYTYNKQVKAEILSELAVPKILQDNIDTEGILKNVSDSKLSQKLDSINVSNQAYASFYKVNKNMTQYTGNEIYGTKTIYSVEAPIISNSDSDSGVLGFLKNGDIDTNKEPLKYYLNYYFHENMPNIDIYIADVWYGYYNKNYYYNEPEITLGQTTSINPTEYVELSKTNGTWFAQKQDAITALKSGIDEYIKGAKFEADANNRYLEYVEQQKQAGNIIVDGYKEEFLKDYKKEKEQELKSLVDKTTEIETLTTYIRDTNITQTIYNISNSEQALWSENEISAENMYFAQILKQHRGAYTSLQSLGEWFIETLAETDSTKNVASKVQYLLNKAYDSEDFGTMEGNELFSLYLTNSVDVNIPSNGKFTEIAKACHDYIRLNNYYYSSGANKQAGNYVQDGPSTGRYVPVIMGEAQNQRYIDCSAYVTWVLMQSGNLGSETIWQWTSTKLYTQADGGIDGVKERVFLNKADMIQFFETVDTSKYGYILVKKGHTEIFAGIQDGSYCTYNAGSTSSIRKEKSKYSKDGFFNHFSSSEYKVLIVGGSENNG